MDLIQDLAKNIRLLVLDVDGVLTSGLLTYTINGIEGKNFHVHDGQGLKLLQTTGVKVGIITTCKSAITKKRMQDLNITHLYQGQQQKLAAYEHLKANLTLHDKEIAYVGDDIPDLPILKRVGLSFTVPNASAIIKQQVHFITRKKAGKGAVREVCDLIMQAQNTYEQAIEALLLGLA